MNVWECGVVPSSVSTYLPCKTDLMLPCELEPRESPLHTLCLHGRSPALPQLFHHWKPSGSWACSLSKRLQCYTWTEKVKIHSCYCWNTSCTCSACSFCWSIPELVWDKAALPFMSRGGWFFPSWFKSKDLFTPALPTDPEPLVCLLPFVMCERLELLFCDCWFACISLRAVPGYLTVVHPSAALQGLYSSHWNSAFVTCDLGHCHLLWGTDVVFAGLGLFTSFNSTFIVQREGLTQES